ncbi:UDP-N-acetylmuramoyl-tripeptide--D-alanyl-D-alanine ligase [Alkalicoccus daliensis]|uniref:UDP-N-acetylmuramoyl-tripeptide--D-alanyl-D-alanine ligase n=1 Tax=Alkalicoccus daliensis TaxID=745820 RepID=A0A1H0D1R5_9BACI|nr:UDP-N-acetylmuramoyl-tripeptide--D-alanyl-D-alanine ligase [Alkalicoccus daliensis]SDN63781.1 UDP-N-acetylmuramoyl-tripeptide--D-alanyl-D-alanine ligase [Alkalicoccus daliensis]
MIKKSLQEIAVWTKGEAKGTAQIAGVSTDTRTIKEGNLFVPISGENFNGHDFAATAMENGAVAALWGRNEAAPPKTLPVVYVDDTLKALQELAKNYLKFIPAKTVGITGSNGKTTTKDMTAAILGTTYKVQKTEGNYNNHIGLPLTVLALDEDTDIAVLEMGMSSRGEIEFLSSLAKPEAAIITNIGESHLQDLGSREGISEAKFEITAGLKENGTLVIPGNEPLLTAKVEGTPFNVLTFGSTEDNDYYSMELKQEKNGTYFTVNKAQEEEYFIPVLGSHNVNNALAAIAVAQQFNVPASAVKKGLQQLKVTGMRTELLEGKNGVTVINDAYNASPTSTRAAVSLLEDMEGYNKKIVVLADMLELGENEETFHFETGESIDAEKIDAVFTFGTLGRKIAEGAAVHFAEDQVAAFEDKQELIQALQDKVAEGDIILVKGSRGMKLEEVVEAVL